MSKENDYIEDYLTGFFDGYRTLELDNKRRQLLNLMSGTVLVGLLETTSFLIARSETISFEHATMCLDKLREIINGR